MYKYVVLKEGQSAIYTAKGRQEQVFLCNIKKDQYNKNDYIFSLKNKDGKLKPGKFIASASIGRCVDLVNSEYCEGFKDKKFVVKSYFSDRNSTETKLKMKKIHDLKMFFQNHVSFNGSPLKFDDEQLDAILSDQNTLLTARAGSGKTRVIVGKIIKLIEQDNLKPEQILALTFNKDAKNEINSRLCLSCQIDGENKFEKNEDIAKTFHSYALKMFNVGEEQILTDKKSLLKNIINRLKDNSEEIRSTIYQFFRSESLRIDRKFFHDSKKFYEYVRNSKYITLNNEKVKSLHEKYIADFLFEHGIAYVYERSFYPFQTDLKRSGLTYQEKNEYSDLVRDKKETHPDFYLTDYDVVWEHWAVNGKESKAEIYNFNNEVGDYDDYLKNKEWKKAFWDKTWISKLADINEYNKRLKKVKAFIETDYPSMKNKSREEIELYLKNVLENLNIPVVKLDSAVLEKMVLEKRIDGFTLLIEQFVNKLQQNYFEDLAEFENNLINIKDDRARAFCKIGMRVYNAYIKILHDKTDKCIDINKEKYNADFNELIYKAALKIRAGEVNDDIKKLKWILIDEYQDFSKLFDFLVKSILQINPEVKVFCVGDDWQAINRFAGSNLKYYNEFEKNFNNAVKMDLSTNYRSASGVVKFANQFAHKFGFNGKTQKVFNESVSGCVIEKDISTVYADAINLNNKYRKLFSDDTRNIIEKMRYLIECERIIKENQNKSIYFLCRSNMFLGMELEYFEGLLKKLCSEFMSNESFCKNVHVKTVHRSKGEEANIVVLIDVNDGVFPVYNSNNALFSCFGESLEDTVSDEEKLYYVALTRAIDGLYIYYRDKNRSPFISNVIKGR